MDCFNVPYVVFVIVSMLSARIFELSHIVLSSIHCTIYLIIFLNVILVTKFSNLVNKLPSVCVMRKTNANDNIY